MQVAGFEWDDGNIPKVLKHGVSQSEIEEVFRSAPYLAPDLRHSDFEDRFRAVGRTQNGRYVFVVFTFRMRLERHVIRPISARFMHAKEIAAYEKAISKIEDGS